MWVKEISRGMFQTFYSFLGVSMGVFLLSFYGRKIGFEETLIQLNFILDLGIVLFFLVFLSILFDAKKNFAEKSREIVLLFLFNIVAMFVFLFMDESEKSKKKCIFDILYSLVGGIGIFVLVFFPFLGKTYLVLRYFGIVVLFCAGGTLWHLLKVDFKIKWCFKMLWVIGMVVVPYLVCPVYYYLHMRK
ncbi:hypothetical protein BREVNS_0554 [Brevinematales bacterium NS]|jgi:hypothetical protein|nr:hypothetical protein BREVNS_0554 [Brevinematales bacterium NS]